MSSKDKILYVFWLKNLYVLKKVRDFLCFQPKKLCVTFLKHKKDGKSLTFLGQSMTKKKDGKSLTFFCTKYDRIQQKRQEIFNFFCVKASQNHISVKKAIQEITLAFQRHISVTLASLQRHISVTLASHQRHISVTLASHQRHIHFSVTLASHQRHISVTLASLQRHISVTLASLGVLIVSTLDEDFRYQRCENRIVSDQL